jgi:hypothetical protein
MDDNSCLSGTAQSPAKVEPGGSFDVMRKTILANSPGFIVFEDMDGLLHPIFPHSNMGGNFGEHVYVGDAINDAYLTLRRSLRLECSILELIKRENTDIL